MPSIEVNAGNRLGTDASSDPFEYTGANTALFAGPAPEFAVACVCKEAVTKLLKFGRLPEPSNP